MSPTAPGRLVQSQRARSGGTEAGWSGHAGDVGHSAVKSLGVGQVSNNDMSSIVDTPQAARG